MYRKNELCRIEIRYNRNIPYIEFSRLYTCNEYRVNHDFARKFISLLFDNDYHLLSNSAAPNFVESKMVFIPKG